MRELSHEDRIELAVAILTGQPIMVWDPETRVLKEALGISPNGDALQINVDAGDATEACPVCGSEGREHTEFCTMEFCERCGFETEHTHVGDGVMRCCNEETHS